MENKKTEGYFLVKLVKLTSDHKNLKTKRVVGYTEHLPKLKEPFIIFTKGLKEGLRMIKTSNVDNILNYSNDKYLKTIKTEFSTYDLYVLEENVPIKEVEEFFKEYLEPKTPPTPPQDSQAKSDKAWDHFVKFNKMSGLEEAYINNFFERFPKSEVYKNRAIN